MASKAEPAGLVSPTFLSGLLLSLLFAGSNVEIQHKSNHSKDFAKN